jgi:acetaldehyde dehydrogenase
MPGYAAQNGWKVSVFLEVRGNGDYLPPYAGNLDIMTAAALRTGEVLACGPGAHDV